MSPVSSGLAPPSDRSTARHWRNRAAGLATAEPLEAAAQSLQVSSGSSEFPARVSTATAVPGGVRASHSIRPNRAAPPASSTRERYRPSVRGPGPSASTRPGLEAPRNTVSPPTAAAVTCSESTRSTSAASPSRETR